MSVFVVSRNNCFQRLFSTREAAESWASENPPVRAIGASRTVPEGTPEYRARYWSIEERQLVA